MPLAVYKSLIQKMVRQDDARLGHVVTLGVQCLEAPVEDSVDPNARIRVISNIRNRLLIFPVEEGALLMLEPKCRKILVQAYGTMCSAFDQLKEGPSPTLVESCRHVSTLLRRCKVLHCRAISFMNALWRLVYTHKEVPLGDDLPVDLSRRVQFLRENPTPFLQSLGKSHLAKTARKLLAKGTLAHEFYQWAKKVVEITDKKLVHTMVVLQATYPHVFGCHTWADAPSPEDRATFPSLSEMRDMHVLDKHCGYATSGHDFSLHGGATPHLSTAILQQELQVDGTTFTLQELRDLYQKEKAMDDQAKALAKTQPKPKRKRKRKEAELVSSKKKRGSAAQCGFKWWAFRYHPANDGKKADWLRSIITTAHDDAYFIKLVDTSHEAAVSPNVEYLQLMTEVWSQFPNVRLPQTYQTHAMSALAYQGVEPSLTSWLLNDPQLDPRWAGCVQKAMGKVASANPAYYHWAIQEWIPMQMVLDVPASTRTSSTFCKSWLWTTILNAVTGSTDFNARNVGWDGQRCVRYDLNPCPEESAAFATQRKVGIATAQRIKADLLQSLEQGIKELAVGELAQGLDRVREVLQPKSADSPIKAQVRHATLHFFEGCPLVQASDAEAQLQHMVQLARTYDK